MSFNPGDRVDWQYTHSLNSRSKVERVKTGTFMRVLEPKRNKYAAPIYGVVQFDGNKGISRVLLNELRAAA